MGHWYKPSGEPYYSVVGKNGLERDVTLRDARCVGAAPSVTTVLNVLPKPALEAWKVRQGILAALTLPRGDMDELTFLDQVEKDSKRQAQEAAQEGSRIHDAIEDYFSNVQVPETYWKHVDATRAELKRLFPDVTDWISEKSFYHPLGFGGKVDLHSPSTGIVVDFKGKDGDFSDGKKLAYDQNIQLAAYQVGLGLTPHQTPDPEGRDVNGDLWMLKVTADKFIPCANIFVSRTHPGAVCSHVWSAEDVAYGWSIFESALELWCRMNRYRPADWIQPT